MSENVPFIYHRPSGWARPLEGCELVYPTIKPEIMYDGFPALHVDDAAAGGDSLESLLMRLALLENHVDQLESVPSGSDSRSKFRFTVEVDLSYNVRVVDSETFDG